MFDMIEPIYTRPWPNQTTSTVTVTGHRIDLDPTLLYKCPTPLDIYSSGGSPFSGTSGESKGHAISISSYKHEARACRELLRWVFQTLSLWQCIYRAACIQSPLSCPLPELTHLVSHFSVGALVCRMLFLLSSTCIHTPGQLSTWTHTPGQLASVWGALVCRLPLGQYSVGFNFCWQSSDIDLHPIRWCAEQHGSFARVEWLSHFWYFGWIKRTLHVTYLSSKNLST